MNQGWRDRLVSLICDIVADGDIYLYTRIVPGILQCLADHGQKDTIVGLPPQAFESVKDIMELDLGSERTRELFKKLDWSTMQCPCEECTGGDYFKRVLELFTKEELEEILGNTGETGFLGPNTNFCQSISDDPDGILPTKIRDLLRGE